MISLAQSESGVAVLPRDFDRDPWSLNCLSGIINLRNGALRPHDRAEMMSCLAPVHYDPDGLCPLFERFILQIMGENIERYDFLQRVLGYALTGLTVEQCLFLFFGTGANGKTTLLSLLTRMLGNYTRNTPMETLLAKKQSGEIPIDVARLDGPRIVTAKEVDRGRRLSESLVKELTGQDTVTARFLYGEYFDYIPKFKLLLSSNHKPTIRGTDSAVWRRIKIIRFPVQLPEDQWDKELPDKLWAEAPAILGWLVRGCISWQSLGGLEDPDEIKKDKEEYRAEMDLLGDFLSDFCIVDKGKMTQAKDLYAAYKEWAEEQGITEKERLSQRSFGLALSERGYERDRTTHNRHCRRGLGLLRK
jgi:putative DNA primase/helicase